MIDSKHKNFMAAIDLAQAREALGYAMERLEKGEDLGAVANMRLALSKLGDALEEMYRRK